MSLDDENARDCSADVPLFVLAILALAAPAAAAPADPPVVVTVAGCASLSEQALRASMRIELGALLSEGPAPGADRLVVTCDGARATVVAEDPSSAPPLARSISLDGLPPDARPRLVALVAIELLATRRPQLRQRLLPHPADAAPGASPPPRAGAERPRPRLLAGVGERAFATSHGLWATSGMVRFVPSLGPRFALALDAELGGTGRRVALGSVGGLVASAGAALVVRHPLGRGLALAGGLGARLGLVRLAGHPITADDSARSVTRPWGGPLATLGLSLGRGRACAALDVEAGATLLGARGLAGDAVAIAAAGPWLGLSLAGGWRL
jgi:hypothetical protein